jgi:Rrf2 family iron-sulfur cluster assembly transcriptional regulator
LRLSNKGRYGVCAIFDIAFHNDGRATQIKEIAERQGIPARFLEQIFQDLKRAGLVASRRGPRGGYQLARPAADIRLGDIVRALEGPIELAPKGEAGTDEASEGDATSRAVAEEAFATISRRIEACFDDVTIESLCERGEALGFRRKPPNRYVYVI